MNGLIRAGVTDGVRWNHFLPIRNETEFGPAIRYLEEPALAHGHEYVVLRDPAQLDRELTNAKARIQKMETDYKSSYTAAGLKERFVILPVLTLGMAESALFEMYKIGPDSGVRVILVTTVDRFNALPMPIVQSTVRVTSLCACDLGF